MIAVDSWGSYGEGWPPSSGAAIQVQNLWKKYGDTEAVRGISFDVNKGEIFGLIGPDGAGKTSTFQVLAGVMEPTSASPRTFVTSGCCGELTHAKLSEEATPILKNLTCCVSGTGWLAV